MRTLAEVSIQLNNIIVQHGNYTLIMILVENQIYTYSTKDRILQIPTKFVNFQILNNPIS